MKLLEATGWKILPVGEGTLLSNVKCIFHGVLLNKCTELELTDDEFVTFQLGLADLLPSETHKEMKNEFYCCGVHIKRLN